MPARTVSALLERSSPLARWLADSLCSTPIGADHCGALHGIWPELRLLKLAADPGRHAAFYREALGACAAGGASASVLVSGCADWGMLAAAESAYRHHGARLDATIIDRCPTPLLLCVWYGAEVGMPVRTAAANVSCFDEYESFDVICTHSLLTYYPRDGRRQLVANWHRLLRPGGAVVTVTRLQIDEADGERAMETAAQRASRFGDLVMRRHEEMGIDGDRAELRARAERFAVAQISHPVGSDADLRALFECEGFEVVRLDVRRLEGLIGSREPITGAARSGAYGEIVAVKR